VGAEVGSPGSTDPLARIETLRSLPTLPHILLKTIELCSRPEKGLKEIARLISQDPALSERVLRLANSDFYGLKQKISTIGEALLLLGLEAVKNVAIGSSVCQVFQGPPARHGLNLKRFWWHSARCAAIARLLAVKTAYPSPEEAFLAGLLHDIGKLLLWSNFRREYAAAGGLPAVERSLGLTHAEAGAWLLARWQLGSFLADAVRYHHERAERIAGSFPLVRLVFASNLLCREGSQPAAQAVGLSPGDLESVRAEAEEEARQVAASLEIRIEASPAAAPGPLDRAKDAALVRLVRDYSQLAGISEGFLKACRREEVLEALRRGLALLFDLASTRWFRLEGGALLGEAVSGSGPLSVPYRESSGLLARSLARGEVLDSFSPLAAPSIYDEQLARLLGAEGILCLPLRAEGQGLGVLAAGIRARDHAGLAARETLLGLLSEQASLALWALLTEERLAARIREEHLGSATALTRRAVHEARNPLGIISNYLSILAGKLKDDASIQEDLRILREEIRRVSRIIAELGSLAAPVPAARETVDVNALLSDLGRLSREPLWRSSRIRLKLVLDPMVPPLESEKDRLKQVFLNLLKNAAEAMPSGGELCLQTRLLPGQPPQQRRIEISVRDQGSGIAEEVRARLFEPSVSTKAQEGLGLSIAYGIVQGLGGTIRYETGSSGTTFRVELPLP
jgi:HD-like signal output (HDOD) protein/signal transduction histidine kinase